MLVFVLWAQLQLLSGPLYHYAHSCLDNTLANLLLSGNDFFFAPKKQGASAIE